MTDEYYENDGPFTVVYSEVAKSKGTLAVTQLLATRMMASPYCTVKDFFDMLSDNDLHKLLMIAEDQEDENFGDLILISEMIATGEGLESGTLTESTNRVNLLVSFCAAESLGRKNLVKVHRENMSFGQDMGHKIIIERL